MSTQVADAPAQAATPPDAGASTQSAAVAAPAAVEPQDQWVALDKMAGTVSSSKVDDPPPTPDRDKPDPADDPSNQTDPSAKKADEPAAKTGEDAQETPLIEFKPEDVAGAKQDFEDGTWAAVLSARGHEVPTDFAEDKGLDYLITQETAPLLKQIEEAKTLSFDSLTAKLKPETATMLKLLEMGYSEDMLIQPTREIDGYLKLDDAALVRQSLEWDLRENKDKQAIVDQKMEDYVANPVKLGNEANYIRHGLQEQAKNIITQRTQLTQQFEARKQEAAIAQKVQEVTQFKKALDTVQSFMGTTIPTETKAAIFKIYSEGGLDSLSTAESRAEYAVYKALGQKVVSHLKNTAFQKGKDQVVTKLANIPPQNTGGQRVVSNQKSSGADQWDAYVRSMGGS